MQDSKSVIGQGSGATGEAAAISRSVTGQVSVPYILGGNEVTAVGPYAFSGCQVSAVQLPCSAKEICRGAFCSCDNLAEVSIPASVSAIAFGAFSYMPSTLNISVEEDNSTYTSYNGTLITRDRPTVVAGAADIWMPDGIEAVAESAYYGSSLGAMSYLPSSLRSIGDFAFYDSKSLQRINIPGNVSSVGSHAFDCCSSLTSVTGGASVKNIGSYAFAGTSLTAALLPS